MGERRRPGRPLGATDRHGRAYRATDKRVALWLESIVRNVRQMRIERDLSVSELAEAAGLNEHCVFALERRKTTSPKLDTVIRIAIAMGVAPYEVLQ